MQQLMHNLIAINGYLHFFTFNSHKNLSCMIKLPIKLPSWFNIFKSTRIFHTFSSALMQSDSKSTHLDSLSARSKFLVNNTICSADRLSCPLFTLIYKTPSAGRVARGWVISHDTCAKTLVSPNETNAQPHSTPKLMLIFRNSLKLRPSKRWNQQYYQYKFGRIFNLNLLDFQPNTLLWSFFHILTTVGRSFCDFINDFYAAFDS